MSLSLQGTGRGHQQFGFVCQAGRQYQIHMLIVPETSIPNVGNEHGSSLLSLATPGVYDQS